MSIAPPAFQPSAGGRHRSCRGPTSLSRRVRKLSAASRGPVHLDRARIVTNYLQPASELQSALANLILGTKVLLNRKARRIIFTISLALLLVMATTAGSVWHHHASNTAESTCPICHLGHQAAQQPVVMPSAPALFVVASQSPVLGPVLRATPVLSSLATRAPPSL